MLDILQYAVKNTALILAALLPIINPPGGAPIFLLLTRGASADTRRYLARQVAWNASLLLLAAMFIGSYVLEYFGISAATVRVAGGMLVASIGWKMLQTDDAHHDDASSHIEWTRPVAESRAFYPHTFPLTVGPGSIAVALTLGASVYQGGKRPIAAPLGALLAVLIVAIIIYLCYGFADRIVGLLGKTGTTVMLRLTAFVLLCIGIEIFWGGASDLLEPLLQQRR
ncbi:MarC family protein [Niveibacterium sp.]|uniref:MarC family protein n=1 Tax=Niveibacterium sp. TaxID=2017444 RepID=UPI0035AE81E9